jgi:hypothetical protein
VDRAFCSPGSPFLFVPGGFAHMFRTEFSPETAILTSAVAALAFFLWQVVMKAMT